MEVDDLILKLGNRHLTMGEVAALCGLNVYDTALPDDWVYDMQSLSKDNNFDFDRRHWVICYDKEPVFGKAVNLCEVFAEKLLRGQIINTVDAYEVSVAFRLLQEDQRACHEVSTMKSEYE